MVDHFVSCESDWSHWDSLYTLSEEEPTSEEEGSRPQHFSRSYCHFCEVLSAFLIIHSDKTKCYKEHIKVGLLLSDKVEVLENKNRCLLKIKSELTSQLTESKHLVEFLEKEIDELKLNLTVEEGSHSHTTRDKIKTLYRKSMLHSIRKPLNLTPTKSISMPEKLNTISNLTKQKRKNTLFAALKSKAKEITYKRTTKVDRTDNEPQARDTSWNTLAKEVLEAQKDEESFASRWFVVEKVSLDNIKDALFVRSDVTVVI